MNLKILHTKASGHTALREEKINFEAQNFLKQGPSVSLCDYGAAKTLKFVSLDQSWEGGWHNTPVRQLIICISGEADISASDGDKVNLQAGDALLLEDLTGEGHCTVIKSDSPWVCALIEV